MKSKDVIHAFFIPAFRLQEDVVPGITTHYRPRPTGSATIRSVQPAVRRRPLADALDRARRHAGGSSAWIKASWTRAPSDELNRRRGRVRIVFSTLDDRLRGDKLMAAKAARPGLLPRELLMVVARRLLGGLLTWLVRMSTGHTTFHHYLSGEAILRSSLLAVPLAFLVGHRRLRLLVLLGHGRPTRPEDHSGHGAYTWQDYFRINTDHKVIGIQYTVNSFFFLLVGGLLAMLMRAQLAQPGSHFVSANTYNSLFSVHATLLIFLFIIPVFAGLGNFVIPLMIGAPDMAFPRLNALSFWLLPVAGVIMMLSFLAPGGAFADGWTAYAPLSDTAPVGQTFFSIGVQFAGASSIMTALNFLVTIITMRAPGMSFFRMPLLVWANFATSLLVVIATPFIAASQFFVLLDRALGFNFFNAGQGRRRADVPARLLVLLAPGRLHHDAARLRDHQRSASP